MLRAILGAILLLGLWPAPGPCQELPTVGIAPSEAGDVTIQGDVRATEGGRLPEVNVWVATLAAPDRHLAETRTTATGEFFLPLTLPGGEQRAKTLLVAAYLPGYQEACDLLGPADISSSSRLQIQLRTAEANYDDPDLDLVDAWLIHRLRRLVKGERLARETRRSLHAALRLYRKRRSNREALLQVVRSLGSMDSLPGRLLEAEVLMRLGAWSAAAKMLAPHGSEDEALPERLVLDGVGHSLLREPAQALASLAPAFADLPGDGLVSLELGRAYVTAEKWAAAVRSLEPALRRRALRSQARYLRARALLSMGDLEGASYEAKIFLRPHRKNVPVSVHSFMAGILARIEEHSIHAIDSAMTQPLTELQKAVPELAGVEGSAAPPPGGLSVLLRQVGKNVERFMKEFADTAALEVVRQARLDSKGKPAATRAEEFYYLFTHREWKGHPWIEEYRATRAGVLTRQSGLEAGYMRTSGSASSLIAFHPQLRPGMEFRFIGRQSLDGHPSYVVAFAQRPDQSLPLGSFRTDRGEKTYPVFLQGLAWISADQRQVLRMRTDLLHPLADAQLRRETTEISYRPYHFATTPQTFCLPTRVTVSLEWGRKRLRNEHIFARFWIFKVDTQQQKRGQADPVERAKAAETK